MDSTDIHGSSVKGKAIFSKGNYAVYFPPVKERGLGCLGKFTVKNIPRNRRKSNFPRIYTASRQ